MPRQIIQIVPFLSSKPDGVGDNARLLAEELLRAHAMETIFVTGTPEGPDNDLDAAPWRALAVTERTAGSLTDTLGKVSGASGVIVHFSGYGYHRRGTPVWLVRGLQSFASSAGTARICTMFHELYAVTGKVWNSSFWLSPTQAMLCKQMARLSSDVFTTTDRYKDQLVSWGVAPEVVSVFSTVGELQCERVVTARAPILLIFGSPRLEKNVFGAGLEALRRLAMNLGVSEIWDVGYRTQPPPDGLGDIVFRRFGPQSAGQVLEMLSHVSLGLVDYPAFVLQKSSICAAYAGNGVVPVLFREAQPGEAGGYRFLGTQASPDDIGAAALARLRQHNAKTYHDTRSVAVTARRFAARLAAKRPAT